MQQSKISKTTAILMVAVAVIFDVLQFLLDLLHLIPAVGNIIALITTSGLSVLAWLIFFVWFKMKGVSFTKPSRSLGLGLGFFIELLPIVNMLPAWTFAVVRLIGSMWAEEKAGQIGIPLPVGSNKTTPLNK